MKAKIKKPRVGQKLKIKAPKPKAMGKLPRTQAEWDKANPGKVGTLDDPWEYP